MLKKIVQKIFGKRNSMQRSLMRSFIIAIVLVAILTIVEFSVLVVPKMQDKLIEINIRDKEQIDSLIYVTRKICGFAILNIVIISAVLVRINLKNIFRPIEQINEATKKVALGEYDIELESKREDEIGELTNNFNKMTHGLKSTENLQKEFINNVSHEIKTPVSSIEGFAKFLKDKKLTDEEREEYANIIIEEAKRLENLTGKILKLSKLNNQEIITNKQEIEVAEQIRKAISLLEPKWSKKDIKINVSLEEKTFLGDEDLIFQVWVNIIDNAIKFSNEGGSIDIKVYEKDGNINVEIKDRGIGMKEEELEKVYDRFYQIDRSHSKEGSGLGLAIVKRIVELSEGKIEIKSKENKGTTVIVKLPVTSEKNNKIIIK
jgi:integral membrane sensor signal transduction histidine kinase